MDSRLDPQAVDLEFISKLGEWGTPFVIVFTKADKKKPGAVQANVDQFIDVLRGTWEVLPPFFLTSAKDKTGRDELLDYIYDLIKSFRKL